MRHIAYLLLPVAAMLLCGGTYYLSLAWMSPAEAAGAGLAAAVIVDFAVVLAFEYVCCRGFEWVNDTAAATLATGVYCGAFMLILAAGGEPEIAGLAVVLLAAVIMTGGASLIGFTVNPPDRLWSVRPAILSVTLFVATYFADPRDIIVVLAIGIGASLGPVSSARVQHALQQLFPDRV